MRNLLLAFSAAVMVVPVLPAPVLAREGSAPQARADDGGVHRGQTWRGRDGRLYCRKPNGTTGLIVGGATGALVGREIDSRGERTTGTVLGAALGALLGRHVERNAGRRCR